MSFPQPGRDAPNPVPGSNYPPMGPPSQPGGVGYPPAGSSVPGGGGYLPGGAPAPLGGAAPAAGYAPSLAAPPIQTALPTSRATQPFYKRWWFILLAAVLIVGGIGNALGGGSKGAGTATSAASAPQASPGRSDATAASTSASAEAAAKASAAAASEKAAAAKASASAAAAEAAAAKAAAATQSFSGKGDSVVTFEDLPSDAVIVTLTHAGASNFAVWSVDGNGAQLKLLVNEIGKYSGVVPLNFDSEPAALKIKASGAWTVSTIPATSAPRWDGTAPYSGKGDSVLIVKDAAEGLTPVNVTNGGSSNFVVRAWSTSGTDLLVNEIGKYQGTVLIPSRTLLLEVKSSGNWTLAK